jgi:arylformamidase
MNEPPTFSSWLAALNGWRCLDLTVTLERGIPRWPTHPHLVIDPTVTHEHDGYYCQSLSLAEHCGTHVDAPCHAHADLMDRTIEQLDPTATIGRAVVADLADLALGPGQCANLAQVRAALDRHGLTAGRGDILLINFGWMRHWTTGAGWKHYAMNQPGLEADVADWVLEQGVKAVGTDTIAVGTPVVDGRAAPCHFHRRVLRREVLLIECLVNLELIKGPCLFVAAPLKIAAGSGSPVRALAFVND